ncbi:MAG: PHP domain-containing protein [Peptococcaceae bacterium]|nr:PHP domain-containing protein [Peptococcaceae bacterium]
MKVDLHLHTKESDGCLSVEEIIQKALQKNIKILSITDHQTTSGSDKAVSLANKNGIQVIPGVEIDTVYEKEEIHLLGYFKSTNNDLLQEKLKNIRKETTKITKLMVEKLQQNGLPIKWEEIIKTANNEGVIRKTHIYYAINNNSLLSYLKWNEISSWFLPGGIAYVPCSGNYYFDVVDWIFASGGLPVLAHPGLIKDQSIISTLLSYKPIGLEVYYGYWEQPQKKIDHYKRLSENLNLFATGGSDFHGFFSKVEIGGVDIPKCCIERLKAYLEIE